MSPDTHHPSSSTSKPTCLPQHTRTVNSNVSSSQNTPMPYLYNNGQAAHHPNLPHSHTPAVPSKTFQPTTKTPPQSLPPTTPSPPRPKPRALPLRQPQHRASPATPTPTGRNHPINNTIACLESPRTAAAGATAGNLASLAQVHEYLEETADSLLSRVPREEDKVAHVWRLMKWCEEVAARAHERMAAAAAEEGVETMEDDGTTTREGTISRSNYDASNEDDGRSSPSPFSARWVPSRTFLETVAGNVEDTVDLVRDRTFTLGEAFLAARSPSTIDEDEDSEEDSSAEGSFVYRELVNNHERILRWLERVPVLTLGT